ncbi:MAG: hypothetical protein ACTHN0_19650, partial [Aquihabitans sp.]
WCDTIDHLDHVGLAGDPMRQRWERVRVEGRPALWFQTRPVQPRLPVATDPALGPDAEAEARAALGRRLAAMGLRIDHGHDATAGPALGLGSDGSDGTERWAVTFPGAVDDPASAAVAVAELRLDHLIPFLRSLGIDPADAVPFRPDGQDPPPVVPEPPGWSSPGDGAAARR